eukprot:3492548-Pleurochrysis_carterae.AAC.1
MFERGLRAHPPRKLSAQLRSALTHAHSRRAALAPARRDVAHVNPHTASAQKIFSYLVIARKKFGAPGTRSRNLRNLVPSSRAKVVRGSSQSLGPTLSTTQQA